ncbi:hypothetical protein T492DRAFT_842774 [Pavlovales sp. CCMP2436]|nr:hypothetical protein T492DRAFT_842774 [Pavlovales sp. CCMP2436]
MSKKKGHLGRTTKRGQPRARGAARAYRGAARAGLGTGRYGFHRRVRTRLRTACGSEGVPGGYRLEEEVAAHARQEGQARSGSARWTSDKPKFVLTHIYTRRSTTRPSLGEMILKIVRDPASGRSDSRALLSAPYRGPPMTAAPRRTTPRRTTPRLRCQAY